MMEVLTPSARETSTCPTLHVTADIGKMRALTDRAFAAQAVQHPARRSVRDRHGHVPEPTNRTRSVWSWTWATGRARSRSVFTAKQPSTWPTT